MSLHTLPLFINLWIICFNHEDVFLVIRGDTVLNNINLSTDIILSVLTIILTFYLWLLSIVILCVCVCVKEMDNIWAGYFFFSFFFFFTNAKFMYCLVRIFCLSDEKKKEKKMFAGFLSC